MEKKSRMGKTEKEASNENSTKSVKEISTRKNECKDVERKEQFFNFDDTDCHFELELPKEFQLSSSTLSIDSTTFQTNAEPSKYEDLEIITDINIIERKVSFDTDKNEYYFIDKSFEDELDYEADDEYKEDSDYIVQKHETGNADLTEKIKHVSLEDNLKADKSVDTNLVPKNLELNDEIADASKPVETSDLHMNKSKIVCESKNVERLITFEISDADETVKEDKKVVESNNLVHKDQLEIPKEHEKTFECDSESFKSSGISKEIEKIAEDNTKVLSFSNKSLNTAQSNKTEIEDSSNSTVEMDLKPDSISSFSSVVREAFPTIKNNPFILQDKKNVN